MEDDSCVVTVENIRNSWLKLFDIFFNHVLQATESVNYTIEFFEPSVKKLEYFEYPSGFETQSESEDEHEFAARFANTLKISAESESLSASGPGSPSGNASRSSIKHKPPYVSALEYGPRYVLELKYGSKTASGHASRSVASSGRPRRSVAILGHTRRSSSTSARASRSASPSRNASRSASASRNASRSASASRRASGSASVPGYASRSNFKIDFSELFQLYDAALGYAVVRLLDEVACEDIDQFYQNIKSKIWNKKSLEIFLKRLTYKFLNGSPQMELYFFAIISRIYVLVLKMEELVDIKTFIEVITDTIFERAKGLQLVSINTHELLFKVMDDSTDWIDDFKDIKCGDVSYYFSP